MKRKTSILMIILCIICMGCNNNITDIQEINNKQENDEYNIYIKDDGIFKLTLFVQKEPHFHDKNIDIYSTLEYIGEEESIKISHGLPYFGYALYDSNGVYFNQIIVDDVYCVTEINKGDVEEISFFKSIGWNADDPDAKIWEEYAKDKELKLPKGKYHLTASCLFDLVQDNEDIPYSNFVEVEFNVN